MDGMTASVGQNGVDGKISEEYTSVVDIATAR